MVLREVELELQSDSGINSRIFNSAQLVLNVDSKHPVRSAVRDNSFE